MRYQLFLFKRLIILFIVNLLSIECFSLSYNTQVFTPNIKSLRAIVSDDSLSYPILKNGSGQYIIISFDELSHQTKNYSYRIIHCENDWSPSNGLDEIDYLKGFNNNSIEKSYQSINTTVLYTHYSFDIPNDDISLLLSGNYVAEIFDSSNQDSIVGRVCFSISEDASIVSGKITPNTELEVNTKYQKLEFDLDCSSFAVSSPNDQLKIIVRQNGRIDNQVLVSEPTFSEGSVFHYKNSTLIFEGGNEYETIDFSDHYNFSGSIENIRYVQPYYCVKTIQSTSENFSSYKYKRDVNGKFLIHEQKASDNSDIDYSLVNFVFKPKDLFLDGYLYILGNFDNNKLNNECKMTYNPQKQLYEKTLLLKNGGYNYLYIFVPSGTSKGTLYRTSGNHWETENDYQVFVYYRPFGSSYDRLIDYTIVNSLKK